MKYLANVIFLLLGACLFLSCLTHAKNIRVGVTSSITQEIVQEVGAERVKIIYLDNKSSIDSDKNRCDLIFKIGLGLEPWLDAPQKNKKLETPITTLSDGLAILQRGQPFHNELALPHTDISKLPSCCQEDARKDNRVWQDMVESLKHTIQKFPSSSFQSNAAPDPYVWLDINNVMSMVVTVNDILAEYDLDYADQYDKNADAYIKKLQTLDIWVRGEIEALPAKQRILLTSHDKFRYFAKRYGLLVPIHFPSASQDSKQVLESYSGFEKIKFPAAFIDGPEGALQKEFTHFAAKQDIDTTTLLTSTNSNFPKYEAMMRHNVNTLFEHLEK